MYCSFTSIVPHKNKSFLLISFLCNCLEGDMECFSEYMELWIHRMRTEGLKLWLSAMLRIQGEKGCFSHKGANLLPQSNKKKHYLEKIHIFGIIE